MRRRPESPLTADERRALRRAERTIREVSDTALARLGAALRTICDGRLYRDRDPSWSAYVERTLGTTAQFAAALMRAEGYSKLTYEWYWHLQGGRKAHQARVYERHLAWVRLKELGRCPVCGHLDTRFDHQAHTQHCPACAHIWPEDEGHAQARQAYYGGALTETSQGG